MACGRRIFSEGVESRGADILDHGEYGKKEMIIGGDNNGIGENAIVVLVEDRGRRGVVEVEAAANHEQCEGGDYMIGCILEARVGTMVVEEEERKERLKVECRASRCHCHSLLPFLFGIATTAAHLLHPFHSLSSIDLTYDPNATLSRHPPPPSPPISSGTPMLPSSSSSNFIHDVHDSTPSPYCMPSPLSSSDLTCDLNAALFLLLLLLSLVCYHHRAPTTPPGPTKVIGVEREENTCQKSLYFEILTALHLRLYLILKYF